MQQKLSQFKSIDMYIFSCFHNNHIYEQIIPKGHWQVNKLCKYLLIWQVFCFGSNYNHLKINYDDLSCDNGGNFMSFHNSLLDPYAPNYDNIQSFGILVLIS